MSRLPRSLSAASFIWLNSRNCYGVTLKNSPLNEAKRVGFAGAISTMTSAVKSLNAAGEPAGAAFLEMDFRHHLDGIYTSDITHSHKVSVESITVAER